MTIQSQRLYYENPYLTSFESAVVSIEQAEGQFAVVLQQSAFYPTSGGQPHDEGYINKIPVTDVYINDAGQVVHVLKPKSESLHRPLTPGQAVTGQIDWTRRHNHMQHHTGQHILSACFEHLLDTDTIGFHLGTEDVTIDIDKRDADLSQIQSVEDKANEIIASNLPVRARFIENTQLQQFRLRRPAKVSSDIRIVSIGEFDDNACGGTHVGNTAEVRLLKILRTERMKKGLRIHFLCGNRAVQHYQREHRILSQLGEMLSAGISDLKATVESLRQELKTAKKNEKVLRKETAKLLGAQAAGHACVYKSGLFGSVSYVNGPYQAGDAKSIAVETLAAMENAEATGHTSGSAAAVVTQEGQKAYIAVVSSLHSTVHCGDVLQRILAAYDGKGGGGPQSAQGSVPNLAKVTVDELREQLETVLSQC